MLRINEQSRFSILNFIKLVFTIFRGVVSAFFALLMVFFLFSFASLFFGGVEPLKSGNVAVIPLTGIITTSAAGGFIPDREVVSHKVVDLIGDAEKNDDIKAIVFEINSPGGSPVATYEIAQAIQRAKKPTMAVIREVGASGGYWVAASAKEVWANPLSVTGSIGVIGSHLEYAGLLSDYNVTYRRLVAGKYKDVGSPWKVMIPEEEKLVQGVLDKLHDSFIDAVAVNRHLPRENVEKLATGFIYLGSEAKELGLVDSLGTMKDAISALETRLNISAELVTYKERKSFLEMLGEVSGEQSFVVGKGIGTALFHQEFFRPTV